MLKQSVKMQNKALLDEIKSVRDENMHDTTMTGNMYTEESPIRKKQHEEARPNNIRESTKREEKL